MKPTCYGVITDPYYRDNFPKAPAGIPRGNLLEISVNPYTGQVAISFQRSEAAIKLIEDALNHIDWHYGAFGNFARPIIEAEPRYALRAVV